MGIFSSEEITKFHGHNIFNLKEAIEAVQNGQVAQIFNGGMEEHLSVMLHIVAACGKYIK